MATVRRKTLADGRILVVREDGSTYIIDPASGSRQDVSGPNPDMAEAFGVGDVSYLDQQLAAIEAYESSPAGQRADQLRAEAYDERVRQFDVGADLQRDQFGLSQELGRGNLDVSRQNADTSRYNAETGRYSAETGRYSAETSRMDTEARIAELERRFGLDVAKWGTDYVKTGIEYAKTPKRWIDSLMWERGATPIFQTIAQGRQLPAFGAKSTGEMPAMNSIGDTMSGLGFTNAGQQFDPAKAVQQVIKAVPPGQSPAGQFSPQEVAAINLAAELYRAGGTNLAEGRWESMAGDEQEALLGTMDWLAPNGGARFLEQKSRTRIPTRSSPYAA